MTLTKNKFIGDRAFYRRVLAISLPMIIQNGVTNLVSLLDNIMVGTVSTEAMSGVSIINQFVFVFNLLIFGAVSAAGLFTAQYHGMGDEKGVRYTFRFKLIMNLSAAVLATVFFAVFADGLINSFLHESQSEANLELTRIIGKEYLTIMLVGLVPYAISQVYASTMRETGDTTTPMVASTTAVFTNLVLNYILIFGHFGLPALGASGAAIATVISRFAELAILTVKAHIKTDIYAFARGAFKGFYIPKDLMIKTAIKGTPIMLNELLWAAAITARNSCYATRGLDVVAALNISTTICNLFNVVYMSIGASIAIIVGNLLGAGKTDEARDTARKTMVFSIFSSVLMALILSSISTVFPMIYNTSDEVRHIATFAIIITAVMTPFYACAHSAYFTIRSGGKVMITVLFDSVFVWTISYPIAAALSYLTDINIFILFPICQGVEIIKAALGLIFLKKVNWANRIVESTDQTLDVSVNN